MDSLGDTPEQFRRRVFPKIGGNGGVVLKLGRDFSRSNKTPGKLELPKDPCT